MPSNFANKLSGVVYTNKDKNDSMVKEWTTDANKGDKGNARLENGITYYPVWYQNQGEMQLADNLKNTNTDTTSGGFSGVDYNYFTNLLKSQMEEGDPNQQLYRQNLQSNINKGVDTSSERMKEQLAQSGMSRSGVATGAMANLEMGRADALGNAEVQLSAQDQAYRQNALTKLLGLQELGLQELGQNKSFYTNLLSQYLNNEQFNTQMNYQKDQDKFNFWRDMMPGLINAGGKIVGAKA